MPQAEKSFPLRQILVRGIALLVPCFFYLLLARTNLNMPVLDDYENVLGFLNHYSQLSTAGQKAFYVLTAQHNEYKLIFEHSILVAELSLLGHLNFLFLSTLGNLSILLLAAALWKMFLPQLQDKLHRLTLFLPVILLLFQLQYYEDLNWTTTALQNLPVVPFSFFSLYFLLRNDRRSVCYAFLMLALAICTSGNGLFVSPVGLLILFADKRWRVAAAWVGMTGLLAGIYFFHYNARTSLSAPGQSIFVRLLHFNVFYFLSFLGSAAENAHRLPFRGASFVLGIALILSFVYALRRGYYQRNRFLAASCLFVLLTAIGVAGLRSDLGIAAFLTSRYHLYSDLLLIFCYIFLAEEFLEPARNTVYCTRIYATALLISFVFCLANNWMGYHSLLKRRNLLLTGMRAYLHPDLATGIKGPVILNSPGDIASPHLARAGSVLARSIELGIYRPPDPE